MIEFLKNNFLYITAILTGAKWVYEYSNKLKWEKNKFLLDRLEIFFNDNNTKNIHLMLDWNKIKIKSDGVEYKINDDIIFEALQTHDVKHTFDTTEIYIRGAFDEYFDKLNEFIILYDAGMISEKSLRSFLRYWIDILKGKKKSKSKTLINQFSKYLDFYGYRELNSFIKKDKTYIFNF
jgi:hypothetical protein